VDAGEDAGVHRSRARIIWTFVITSLALFMVQLDNLVVTTALPVIRHSLHASLSSLEWTVNAYTLTFAVLLLTGAALGDRLGRRRTFTAGIALFTLGSVGAALAPTAHWLVAARALQGIGGAVIMPLTLTILSAAVPPNRRGVALGAWGGVGGLAVAMGPLIGGAIVQGISWQWIFWVNVPIGLALAPLAARMLSESHGPDRGIDAPGVALASSGLFAIVWGLVRANTLGWTSTEILDAIAAGAVLLAGFVAWELRATSPMLPMRFFRSRTFSATNLVSLLMFFGMFGSIFLLTQFFQGVQGYSPLQSGLRILPWTIMPIFVAPLAGALSARIGGGWLITIGLALQATGLWWIAQATSVGAPYSHFIVPFVMSGVGMAMYFAPAANVVLTAVRSEDEGKSSGANNAIRELGGVLGVAVLAGVFAHNGSYANPGAFVHGLRIATETGAVVVAAGAVAALFVPRRAGAVAGGAGGDS
jgi:EmrB/QacA subfamily drug resistance transporter